MSDDLADEVEAINSIYGPDTLAPADPDPDGAGPASGPSPPPPAAADRVYVLRLPGDDASWLRVRFPAAYPGARHARLFAGALGRVYVPGAVCVFDAVEEFAAAADLAGRDEEDEEEEAASRDDEADGDAQGPAAPPPTPCLSAGAADAFPPPEWTVSAPVVDSKSTFVAHVARVSSPAQARAHVAALLASDRRFRAATHNMTAWRIRGGAAGVAFQDCDDDGETAAGGRLLRLMQAIDLWDAMVVVSRWYGGVKLGPRRFALINSVARDAFVRAGMIVEKDKKKTR